MSLSFLCWFCSSGSVATEGSRKDVLQDHRPGARFSFVVLQSFSCLHFQFRYLDISISLYYQKVKASIDLLRKFLGQRGITPSAATHFVSPHRVRPCDCRDGELKEICSTTKDKTMCEGKAW